MTGDVNEGEAVDLEYLAGESLEEYRRARPGYEVLAEVAGRLMTDMLAASGMTTIGLRHDRQHTSAMSSAMETCCLRPCAAIGIFERIPD